MITCDACGAKSTLALCNRCVSDLKKALNDLPTWVDWLADTALKRTRSGSGGRVPHGDSQPLPYDGDTEKGKATRQGQARELMSAIRNSLTTIVRDLCEQRGVTFVDRRFIGPLRANEIRNLRGDCESLTTWLAEHVSAIATSDGAAETVHEIRRHQADIERIINPPVQLQTCGPCPTPGEHTDRGFVMSDVRAKCGTRLSAKASADTVTCPVCKQTHDVEALTARLLNDMHYMSFTIRELLDVVLPRANEHIPRRTLYDWAAKGKMNPSGRDDGGTPKFTLADVRKLRAQYVRKSA